jgi:cytochrome b6
VKGVEPVEPVQTVTAPDQRAKRAQREIAMATQAQAASAQEPTRKSWIDYIQKDLPEHLDWWPYTLGAIPMTLFGVLVVTGLLLTLYYVPSAEEAYESVEQITSEVYLGWFVRGMHKVSVDLMILFLLFHVIRVFLTRAYRPPGELKWVSGSIVLFVTFAMGFTGYSLVYDNVSYWGMTVVTDMIGNLPVVGTPLMYLLRGGPEVSGRTLLRLYDCTPNCCPPCWEASCSATSSWCGCWGSRRSRAAAASMPSIRSTR